MLKQLKLWDTKDSLWITLDTRDSRGTNMALTSTFNKILDKHGTLNGLEPLKGSPRAALRLARGVALAIGIALCSASPAGQATTMQQNITPFRYATFQIGEVQAECLFRIAIKESNINYKAVNKTSGAVGAWQFMNPRVAKLDAYDQVDWAIRYAVSRYGSPCEAWTAWKQRYWW